MFKPGNRVLARVPTSRTYAEAEVLSSNKGVYKVYFESIGEQHFVTEINVKKIDIKDKKEKRSSLKDTNKIDANIKKPAVVNRRLKSPARVDNDLKDEPTSPVSTFTRSKNKSPARSVVKVDSKSPDRSARSKSPGRTRKTPVTVRKSPARETKSRIELDKLINESLKMSLGNRMPSIILQNVLPLTTSRESSISSRTSQVREASSSVISTSSNRDTPLLNNVEPNGNYDLELDSPPQLTHRHTRSTSKLSRPNIGSVGKLQQPERKDSLVLGDRLQEHQSLNDMSDEDFSPPITPRLPILIKKSNAALLRILKALSVTMGILFTTVYLILSCEQQNCVFEVPTLKLLSNTDFFAWDTSAAFLMYNLTIILLSIIPFCGTTLTWNIKNQKVDY